MKAMRTVTGVLRRRPRRRAQPANPAVASPERRLPGTEAGFLASSLRGRPRAR